MKRKREDYSDLQQYENKIGKTEDTPQIWSPAMMFQQEIELRMIMDNLVNIYEKLDQSDNPHAKPNYSYSEMVYLAILRSKNFCLPLAEIYRYMQTRFTFFKNTERKNWRNAVRHSLSKTKCFGKINVGRNLTIDGKHERSTNLWCIEPKSIASFARGDYRCTSEKNSGTNSLRLAYFRLDCSGMFWDKVGTYLELKKDAFVKKLDKSDNPGKIFNSQVCQIAEADDTGFDSGVISHFPDASAVVSHSAEGIRNTESTDRCHMTNPTTNDSGNETIPYANSFQINSRPEISMDPYKLHAMPPLGRISTSPELPDLGNVSPLSLSPVPSFGIEQLSPVNFQTNNSEERNSTTPPLSNDFFFNVPHNSTPINSHYGQISPPFIANGLQMGSIAPPYNPIYPSTNIFMGVSQHSTPYTMGSRLHGTNITDQSSLDMGYHTFYGNSCNTNDTMPYSNSYNFL
ncbi:hypothetical protein FSP39_015332 [Pinctada imbricata]|uniref:Fork-head domain-containing protein n=1 Tax=Pinctada imbricata TaxID=66713 RepID=A0AA88XT14_PINIB|nr:hypothetical protein FSP39_015332 [Pinctada imbricata]